MRKQIAIKLTQKPKNKNSKGKFKHQEKTFVVLFITALDRKKSRRQKGSEQLFWLWAQL
jgi:hypothetical protein